MTNEEAVAKAEQDLSTSSYLAEVGANPGMRKIHSRRCAWLSVVVRLAKQALEDKKTIRLGRWENGRTCSACGEIYFGYDRPAGNFKFCPNCGAHMEK